MKEAPASASLAEAGQTSAIIDTDPSLRLAGCGPWSRLPALQLLLLLRVSLFQLLSLLLMTLLHLLLRLLVRIPFRGLLILLVLLLLKFLVLFVLFGGQFLLLLLVLVVGPVIARTGSDLSLVRLQVARMGGIVIARRGHVAFRRPSSVRRLGWRSGMNGSGVVRSSLGPCAYNTPSSEFAGTAGRSHRRFP